MIALVFVGFPFVVRSIQPALEDLHVEVEEAVAAAVSPVLLCVSLLLRFVLNLIQSHIARRGR